MLLLIRIKLIKMKISAFSVLLMITIFSPSKQTYSQGYTFDFGAANQFVVFSNDGAVSNVDDAINNSNYGGSVGANAGAVSGYVAARVAGRIHPAADAITAQARTDLTSAYTDIQAIPADQPLHSTTFGNETLFTGVYAVAGAVNIATDLTLDGGGDTNAYFIFKFSGATTFETLSRIILDDGARPENVFWVVQGAVTIETKTIVKGIIIANNAAITMATGSDLHGRLYSTTGAISVTGSDIQNVESGTYNSALPIELISFTNRCEEQYTEFHWSTASEINNDYFSLLTSSDGTNWRTLQTIAGAGNSSSTKLYSYTYEELNEEPVYYRLKQTDYDGQVSYSDIISLEKCGDSNTDFTVFPNPTKNAITLSYNGNIQQILSTSIFNMLGERVYYSESYKTKIELDNKFKGLYFLHVNSKTENMIKKFIVLD
jgi:hypothetical protein